MAISIDWSERVIFVPRNDLTLIQSNPTEIRELNLNWFRLQLKDLEDNADGMVNPDTHRHNTEVSVGGLTLARVIELINDYTVTFEDGQYAVNLVGANSNVGDRVNVNQVSVRSQNSAGMVTSPDIEYSSFNGGVTYKVDSPYEGTIYPIGTPRQPVNNLDDAMLIADYRGFNKIYVIGNLHLGSGVSTSGFTIMGQGANLSSFVIDAAADVFNTTLIDATVNGTLDGYSRLERCVVQDLDYIDGFIYNSILDPGTVTLGGGHTAHFLNCWSGVPGTDTPVIDFNGSGQGLALRNYNGGIKLINKTGTESCSIDLNSGQVKVDLNTVTNGVLVVRGIGKCVDANDEDRHLHTGIYGNLQLINETVDSKCITNEVWSYTGP